MKNIGWAWAMLIATVLLGCWMGDMWSKTLRNWDAIDRMREERIIREFKTAVLDHGTWTVGATFYGDPLVAGNQSSMAYSEALQDECRVAGWRTVVDSGSAEFQIWDQKYGALKKRLNLSGTGGLLFGADAPTYPAKTVLVFKLVRASGANHAQITLRCGNGGTDK